MTYLVCRSNMDSPEDDMPTPEQDEAHSADQLLTTLKDHWVKDFAKGDTELGAILNEFMENFQVEMEKHL